MAYLNTTFGSVTDSKFYVPGISKLYLIEKAGLTPTYDVSFTKVTTFVKVGAAELAEIVFEEGTASYSQEYVNQNGKYINQSVSFSVASDNLEQAHSVLLGRKYSALVRRNDGVWLMLGLTNGLTSSAGTSNGSDEASPAMAFTLTGKNLGFGAILEMTDAEVEAAIAL